MASESRGVIECRFGSPESQELGFTVIIDTRGASYNAIKPILKTLEEGKIPALRVHHVYLTKPDTFWQKQRTSLAKGKYRFEVRSVPFVSWSLLERV